MLRRLVTFLSAVSMLLCVAMFILWSRAGHDPVAEHLSHVSAATTVDGERQAFIDLSFAARDHQWSLQFSVRDTSGAEVSLNGLDWPKRAATVDLVVEGHRLTHRL